MKNMKLINQLKDRAKSLKKSISTIFYASKDPLLPKRTKILIIITIGYFMSPIDLIPDFIPILGYIDDLIILPALITFSIKSIPQDILITSRKKAEEQPISLKTNWFFGSLFILIWIIIIYKIIILIV